MEYRQSPVNLAAVKKSIASIDFNALAKKGFINPRDNRNQIMEEFRQIKRPLLNNAFGLGSTMVEKGNLIMVTSSMQNEGKTFASINLAISCAMELDKTVLLVDADLIWPSIFKTFGLPEPLGLSDYLCGTVPNISSLLVRTEINNLVLLSAGTLLGKTAEQLSSGRMRALISELEERYDDRIVIFDTSPLLVSNESRVLAEMVGQVVMVVEEGVTKVSDVKSSLEYLDPNKSISFILNKCTSRHKGGAYYYGEGRKE